MSAGYAGTSRGASFEATVGTWNLLIAKSLWLLCWKRNSVQYMQKPNCKTWSKVRQCEFNVFSRGANFETFA